jgi:hypothetical protein
LVSRLKKTVDFANSLVRKEPADVKVSSKHLFVRECGEV